MNLAGRAVRSYLESYGDNASANAGAVGLGSVRLNARQRRVQEERALIAASRLRRPGLLVLNDPVGTGKTPVALAAARLLADGLLGPVSAIDRILVVSPNEQIAAAWRQRGEWIGLEAGVRPRGLVVRTVSQLANTGNRGLPQDPSRLLLIVDEAHRGLHRRGTVAYRRISRLAEGARVMLVTATPFQLSGHGLETMLEIDGQDDRGDRIRDYASAVAAWLRIQHEHADGTASVADLERAGALVRKRLDHARKDLEQVLMPAYDFDRMGRPRDSRLPSRPHRVPLGSWASTYHVARVVPELLSVMDRDGVSARNSDTYMRMLVSSTAAWRDSAVYKQARQSGRELNRVLDAIERGTGPDPLDHPKVSATAAEVVRSIRRGHHVLVFCVFRATQEALDEALSQALIKARLTHRVEAPDGLSAARRVLREGFGRPAKQGTATVMVVRDNLSESVDLDGGRPMVIHHDLSWSPVRWEQRMGRVIRAGTGFQPPAGIIVPVLDTPVDTRMWDTLKGRARLTTNVTDETARVLLRQSLSDVDEVGDG